MVHAQALQTRDAEMGNLKNLMLSSEKKIEDAEYERDGARACLHQLQGRQQKLQSAVSRVQKEV